MSQPSDQPPTVDPWGDRWINTFWPTPATTVAVKTRRRVSLHLIPYLFFLYILAYLDRVNLSVAALTMTDPMDQGGMGFTNELIGIAGGMFFWGYWILEIPSTLSVERWGARWVFVRILVLWGIAATLMGLIGLPGMNAAFAWLPHLPEQGAVVGAVGRYVNSLKSDPGSQLYFLRFMLGFFEGGFFPSVIVYLTHWFRAQDRAKAVASFMIAIPVSNIIGTPLSGALLRVNWFGLQGWRWIFIIEGIVPVLAGFATLFFLPSRPRDAKWLPPDERDWLMRELESEHHAKKHGSHGALFQNLGMVLLLTGVYFCLNVTSYGLGMFMPKIIQSQAGTGNFVSSLLASLPYVMAFVGLLLNGWHSDRTGERTWHIVVPLAFLSTGIFLAAACDGISAVPVLVMILVVGSVLYAHVPCFWQIPTRFLGAAAAASAIGFINMIGNLGGTVGPYLVGKASTGQSSFAPALVRLGPWPLIAAAVVLIVSYWRKAHAQPIVQDPT